jgi:hypothetical protein
MDKKQEQLGVPFGTACHQLRKEILFELVKEVKRDFCFRCGKQIVTSQDFSIDHKEPWLHSEKPKDLFFSLTNISFSHRLCNTNARRIIRKYSPEEAIQVRREWNAAYMRRTYTTRRRQTKYLTTGH